MLGCRGRGSLNIAVGQEPDTWLGGSCLSDAEDRREGDVALPGEEEVKEAFMGRRGG